MQVNGDRGVKRKTTKRINERRGEEYTYRTVRSVVLFRILRDMVYCAFGI
jgi:hypothetical protein